MARGRSRSHAGLGDRKSGCVVGLPLMSKLAWVSVAPAVKCGIDEVTSVGPSRSCTL